MGNDEEQETAEALRLGSGSAFSALAKLARRNRVITPAVNCSRQNRGWRDRQRDWKKHSFGLLRDPERVGLVEPNIATGFPGVIGFLRHVAHTRTDYDWLADAFHRADREHLVCVRLQDL